MLALGAPRGEALDQLSAGSTLRPTGLDPERERDAPHLSIEGRGEAPGGALEVGAQALALRAADFANPAVLKEGEQREQQGQEAQEQQRRAVTQRFHRGESSQRRQASGRSNHVVYIPYTDLAGP